MRALGLREMEGLDGFRQLLSVRWEWNPRLLKPVQEFSRTPGHCIRVEIKLKAMIVFCLYIKKGSPSSIFPRGWLYLILSIISYTVQENPWKSKCVCVFVWTRSISALSYTRKRPSLVNYSLFIDPLNIPCVLIVTVLNSNSFWVSHSSVYPFALNNQALTLSFVLLWMNRATLQQVTLFFFF